MIAECQREKVMTNVSLNNADCLYIKCDVNDCRMSHGENNNNSLHQDPPIGAVVKGAPRSLQ